jgi:hypothetical protein
MNPIPICHILPPYGQSTMSEPTSPRRGANASWLRPVAMCLITSVVCFGVWLVSVAGAVGLGGSRRGVR